MTREKRNINSKIIDVKSYNKAMDALHSLINRAENKKYEKIKNKLKKQ